MAKDSTVHVVLINPGGSLIQRSVNFNEGNGSSGVENACKSALEVVAVYVVRDIEGDAGGPFWDEYSGNSQYGVVESYDGITVVKRDLTGATKGCTKKSYYNNAASPGPNTPVASAFEETTIGAGANWPVLDDGQGSNYEAKLAEARTLVGLPS
jgi:hypothetical protein